MISFFPSGETLMTPIASPAEASTTVPEALITSKKILKKDSEGIV